MAEQREMATQPVIDSNDLKLTNPDGVRAVYSNEIGISLTSTDIRLMFAEIGPVFGAEANPPAEKVLRANVVIPFQQAASLAQFITSALAHQAEQAKTEPSSAPSKG